LYWAASGLKTCCSCVSARNFLASLRDNPSSLFEFIGRWRAHALGPVITSSGYQGLSSSAVVGDLRISHFGQTPIPGRVAAGGLSSLKIAAEESNQAAQVISQKSRGKCTVFTASTLAKCLEHSAVHVASVPLPSRATDSKFPNTARKQIMLLH
jgi:hypothetical protein